MCRRWIVHTKWEDISKEDILQLLDYLFEEVVGALTTEKTLCESSSSSGYTSTATTLHVHTKSLGPPRKNTQQPEPFCLFCESRSH